jgi:hypothetical protein
MSDFNVEPHSRLPVVTPEVGKAALRNSIETGAVEHRIAIGQKLADEQPYLNRIIGEWVSTTATSDVEGTRMIDVAFLMYELLSGQAEADAMNRQLGEPQ